MGCWRELISGDASIAWNIRELSSWPLDQPYTSGGKRMIDKCFYFFTPPVGISLRHSSVLVFNPFQFQSLWSLTPAPWDQLSINYSSQAFDADSAFNIKNIPSSYCFAQSNFFYLPMSRLWPKSLPRVAHLSLAGLCKYILQMEIIFSLNSIQVPLFLYLWLTFFSL